MLSEVKNERCDYCNNQTDQIDSQTLLKMVNEARKLRGEREIRNNDFLNKVKDELDGEFYETFVKPSGTKGGRPIEVINMSFKQAMLVATRESKAVRRSVIGELEMLRQQLANQDHPQLPTTPTLREKMDCAQLIMNALPNLSEDSKQVMLADLAAEAGMYLPAPVVSDPHKSTTQVAKMLGITPQKLGRLANIYGLKTPDYGEYRLTKAAHCNKHVEQWWWNNAGVERLENLLGGAE